MLKSLSSQLEDVLHPEEIYWKSKSREVWLKEGDRNTRFFHDSKKRYPMNWITSIKDANGIILDDKDVISLEAINFFNKHLFVEPIVSSNSILDSIPSCETKEDNNLLIGNLL